MVVNLTTLLRELSMAANRKVPCNLGTKGLDSTLFAITHHICIIKLVILQWVYITIILLEECGTLLGEPE